ncbi:MAG: acyltransferase family protein [Fuerstiella sp.]
MNNSLHNTFRYRPEIDGLRAIAVIAVVLYHAGIGCPGGYIGVDLFFVISGFLISSIIIRDLRNGDFSLQKFWTRRARRIFPASTIVLIATLAVSSIVLLPKDLSRLGDSAISQSLFSSNIYFWRTTNYFEGANAEKPLLHTWSLAVEEQFYFIFPFALILLISFFKYRDHRGLISCVGVTAILSLGLSVWGVKHQPFATFFLLPTRAWELLCGTAIALAPTSTVPKSRLTREFASWCGLLVATIPIFVFSDETAFPGLAALPTCLGTCIFIWSNSVSVETKPTTITRLLSSKPLVFIGLISYSVYLWHWPVIALCTYWQIEEFSTLERLQMVGISLVLAIACWRFVETPFRKGTSILFATPFSSLRSVFMGTALTFAIGAALSLSQGLPGRMAPDAQRQIAAIEKDTLISQDLAVVVRDIELVNKPIPFLGKSDEPIASFAVLGDSHAKAAIPAFDSLGKSYGLKGIAITHNATPPLLHWGHRRKHAAAHPDSLWQSAVQHCSDEGIKNIFLIAFWSRYEADGRSEELYSSIKRTVRLLQERQFNVCIVLDVPSYSYNVLRASLRKSVLPFKMREPKPQLFATHEGRNKLMYSLFDENICDFADPARLMHQGLRGVCMTHVDGTPLYRDQDHLTYLGAEIAILPAIDPTMKKIAVRN